MTFNDVPLIARRALFGNPDRALVQISPDGAHLAWLAPRGGVLNVWVAPPENPAAGRPVTKDIGRGIRYYTWAQTGAHLLYLQDKNGDENWRLYAVDLTSDTVKDLTPYEGAQAQVIGVSHKFPEEIIVALNDRSPQWHDIYRLNLVSGERTLVLQHDRFLSVTVDNDYQVRQATQMTLDGGVEIYVPAGAEWQLWDTIPADDTLTTSVVGFDQANRLLYMKDARGRDTAALVAIDLDTKMVQLVAEDLQADAEDVVRHPTVKNIQAVSFIYDRKSWQIIDPDIAPDLAYLRGVAPGELEISSRANDDKFWVVVYEVDDGPARFYLYDRGRQAARFLFTNRQALEGQPLVHMHAVVIAARDGLELVSYYSLPAGSDSDGDGFPDAPAPLVLIPHGGPWGRDRWGYNGWHQWLANRGYAVLSVNFRSSTGLGKAFTNAGNLEWGGKILDDQQDAVRWAVEQGLADPKRIAVMGASFGGYATLAGLAFTPEVFACGVDIVGPSNLITLLETVPPYWTPMLNLLTTRVGDHRTEAGRALLTSHSPLTHADRICRPLLIGQGANDPRVKQAESDQIVRSMQAHGIPVTYVVFPDEGHGFAKPENNLAFHAIAEAFLVNALGGRCEPFGEDLAGSSITVRVGEQYVAGLAEALSGGKHSSPTDGRPPRIPTAPVDRHEPQ